MILNIFVYYNVQQNKKEIFWYKHLTTKIYPMYYAAKNVSDSIGIIERIHIGIMK